MRHKLHYNNKIRTRQKSKSIGNKIYVRYDWIDTSPGTSDNGSVPMNIDNEAECIERKTRSTMKFIPMPFIQI